MNKIILSALLILSAIVSCRAQAAQSKPKKTGSEWHAAGDAPARSKEFTDRLTTLLALDEATSKKVYDIYMANTKSVDEIKFSTDSDAVKNEAMNANQEAFDDKLKSILTASQFTKYKKLARPGK
jgi:hypothetical protein